MVCIVYIFLLMVHNARSIYVICPIHLCHRCVALLRPGRFEVQVEVPPPRTIEQRLSILKVHTKNMHTAGRLLVRDPPPGTAASKYLDVSDCFAASGYLPLNVNFFYVVLISAR